MSKPIFMIDASLLKESDCLQKVNFIHNEGLVTALDNYKMDYGTGFHIFVANYNRGMEELAAMNTGAQFFMNKCVTVPENDFRTLDHFIMMLKAYTVGPFRRDIDLLKPLMINNQPACEIQFTFPYKTTPEFDILLMGTCDLLGTYLGRKVINDYKVTAVWKKEEYLLSYDLDPQLIFYSWILKEYGVVDEYLPGMITGIFLKKPTQSTLVNGKRVKVDCWNGASFERSPLFEFGEKQIAEFKQWLEFKIDSIVNAFLQKQWSKNFNCCTDVYGPCPFRSLCNEYDSAMLEVKKKAMYLRRTYDPSMFQK